MNSPQNPISTHQAGFILITSLLFLVIITLLALSGIGSATLQQKMATNSNDKSQSLQAANSTLAYAESFIKQMNQPPLKSTSCYTVTGSNNVTRASCGGNLQIVESSQRFSPKKWLSAQTWTNAQLYQTPHGLTTHYQITYMHSSGGCLSQSCQAKATSGRYYFSITARSTGANSKAPTVTQSVYRKRY